MLFLLKILLMIIISIQLHFLADAIKDCSIFGILLNSFLTMYNIYNLIRMDN